MTNIKVSMNQVRATSTNRWRIQKMTKDLIQPGMQSQVTATVINKHPWICSGMGGATPWTQVIATVISNGVEFILVWCRKLDPWWQDVQVPGKAGHPKFGLVWCILESEMKPWWGHTHDMSLNQETDKKWECCKTDNARWVQVEYWEWLVIRDTGVHAQSDVWGADMGD
jgi:hypothetical protein